MNPKFKLVSCVLGVFFLAVLTGSTLRSAPPAKEVDATGAFMRAKLASSQKILEGLTTKRFRLIEEGAGELKEMSDAAAWKRSTDAVYVHHSREFRRLAEKLSRLAEKRNLEGASFTYMHMVGTCITCHEHCRDVLRMAAADKQQASPFRLLGDEPTANAAPQDPARENK